MEKTKEKKAPTKRGRKKKEEKGYLDSALEFVGLSSSDEKEEQSRDLGQQQKSTAVKVYKKPQAKEDMLAAKIDMLFTDIKNLENKIEQSVASINMKLENIYRLGSKRRRF